MKGKITFLKGFYRSPEGKPSGGFGFIRDENGRDRFFRRLDLKGVTFDQLAEGTLVTFEPRERTAAELVDLRGRGKGDNGLLAAEVRIA